MIHRNIIFCLIVSVFCLCSLQAQDKLSMKFITWEVLLSPVVHTDGSITFQIEAPEAKEVYVAISGREKIPMNKNSEGLWSVTTEILPPDVYPYRIELDGLKIVDPANPSVTGGYNMTAGQSLVVVPAKNSQPWEFTDVAHGNITRHFYHSGIIGDNRSYMVYTPPNYDMERSDPYPVLYLMHGLSENENAWFLSGKANFILDNLIAENRAEPMLVVCPLGYGNPSQISQGIGGAFEIFERSLFEELIPRLENEYHIGTANTDRAITGLSMGAGQSLYIGINHPDKFAYVGGFSSAVVMYGINRDRTTVQEPEKLLDSDLFEEVFPYVETGINDKLKLLWIATGKNDGEFNYSMEFKLWLKSKNILFEEVITPGQHTWMVWKRNLVDFTQLIFK